MPFKHFGKEGPSGIVIFIAVKAPKTHLVPRVSSYNTFQLLAAAGASWLLLDPDSWLLAPIRQVDVRTGTGAGEWRQGYSAQGNTAGLRKSRVPPSSSSAHSKTSCLMETSRKWPNAFPQIMWPLASMACSRCLVEPCRMQWNLSQCLADLQLRMGPRTTLAPMRLLQRLMMETVVTMMTHPQLLPIHFGRFRKCGNTGGLIYKAWPWKAVNAKSFSWGALFFLRYLLKTFMS